MDFLFVMLMMMVLGRFSWIEEVGEKLRAVYIEMGSDLRRRLSYSQDTECLGECDISISISRIMFSGFRIGC